MAGIYLDTSAIGRALLAEPEARAIPRGDRRLRDAVVQRVAGRRAASARGAREHRGGCRRVPRRHRVAAVDSSSLDRASRVLPNVVRSLDAIHLDAALALRDRGEIDVVMTYDRQLQAGCAHHGLEVAAPAAG